MNSLGDVLCNNSIKNINHNHVIKPMAIDYEKALKLGSKGGLVEIKPRKSSVVGPFYNLQFIGVENLKPFQDSLVKSRVATFYEKILDNYFKNVRYFSAEVKLYEKKLAGKQKYSIHLRLALPSKVFSSEYAGFDIDTPLSRAIKALDKELVRFREKTSQRWRGFRKGRRKVFGTVIYEDAISKGLTKKQIKRKLVKR